jgi:hypothetical protein
MTKRPSYVQPFNMLDPQTCKGSIVATAKGIEAIHFGSTMMELFGSKFVYSVITTLSEFFGTITTVTEGPL